MNSYRYIILGGGMVAGYAAQEFVAQGAKPGELCIVSSESTLPYERPPLSKDFLAGKAERADLLINDDAFYRDHGIELHLNTSVSSVDFPDKQLQTEAGETIGYNKLLIATGSTVRTLGVPGAELQGIHYLRWIEDSQRIREKATKGQRAVVIGGGYIGLEVSSVLAQHGLVTTLVLSGDGLLPRLFTEEISTFFKKYYEDRGVTFVPHTKATALKGRDSVSSVVLDSGAELPADLVIAGVGVAPNTGLFEGTVLEIGQGIVTNEFLETSVQDVYAAGDVANYYDVIFNKQRHVEHWNNATEGGKHAARVMLGQREPFRQLPYFFSDEFDLSWEFWGDTEDFDEVVYRGDIAAARFSAWWLKQERIVAAFVMNRPDEEREFAQQWITAQRRVDPTSLADSSTALQASG